MVFVTTRVKGTLFGWSVAKFEAFKMFRRCGVGPAALTPYNDCKYKARGAVTYHTEINGLGIIYFQSRYGFCIGLTLNLLLHITVYRK